MKLRLFLLSAFIAATSVSQSQETKGYRNPIIPGYHPDPSVCRVQDDYYLVNSSFQYFPAVPIFHSKDLVNWEQIGNVLDRPSQVPLKDASSWTGIYAPTIRYNGGTYYMITTNVGGGGNFLVTAKDPRGPWSEPVWLSQQGIDPSLFFEDGHCYMVSNPDDGIWLCEIDPATGQQLTESRLLWQGTGGRYPEGPHLYKKDGYYYLLISEGGTEYGHKLTIARSKKINGPYTSNPDNPILYHQQRLTQGNQIQGTGHGDLVQAADGSWWLVFLAFRTYGGNYHHLGRETFLAPVEWKKGGWPVVNKTGTVDTLMLVPTLPQTKMPAPKARYDFANDRPGPEWVYMQNPDMSRYQYTGSGLRLLASEGSLLQNQTPTFIGRRQESAAVTVETMVDVAGLAAGAEAGLTVYQIHDGNYRLFLRRDSAATHVVLAYQVKSLAAEREVMTLKGTTARLVITSDGDMYRFACAESGDTLCELGTYNCSMLSSEVAGGFTGVVIGMYAANGGKSGGYADFRYLEYREQLP